MNPPAESLPIDEHDRVWLSHVRPPGRVNPTPKDLYDMVVLGGGPAGLVVAMGAAAMKKKVALIERNLLGGDCLNTGCVPSKALIRAARAAAEVRDAGRFGVKVPPGVQVDFAAVMGRLRSVRASLAPHDSVVRFARAGVDVFLGHGRFTAPDRLDVEGLSLCFRRVCIATGSRPAIPAIPGLAGVPYLTNETIFKLTELPRRLAILGAGPIGCELAQAFARLGSAVTLIETEHGVLPREDRDAAAIVQAAIGRDGVHLLCCGKEIRLSTRAGEHRLNIESHGQNHTIAFDQVLVATGRRPNIEDLALDAAAVSHDARGVTVDDTLRTTNPRIYAAGDVCSKYQFTHAADAMARIVLRNALLPWLPFKARASSMVVPRCTYTDPELAHAGPTPRELQVRGQAHQTYIVSLNDVDRAVLDGQTEGVVKVHVNSRGCILGATMVAAHAGELTPLLAAAMVRGLKLRDLAKIIHPYPTQSEAIKKAADAAYRDWLLSWVRK